MRGFRLMTDAVEKGFFSFDRVRLIQDQAQARNVDSKSQSSRFDCCVFLFHSFRAVTFSTASALSGHWTSDRIAHELLLRLDMGRPDHLSPLVGFFGDELRKVGGRANKCRAIQV